MNTKKTTRKVWAKPVIQTLKISKYTFSGNGFGAERASKGGPPKKGGS
jgi:hypothetical protein